jgi:predicted nucleic-acid-binding protein
VPPHKKGKSAASVPVYLVDTNVILRFLVGDDPPKAARATALMDRVEKAEVVLEVPESVITEVVWTLQSYYKVSRMETAQKVAAFLTLAGIRTRSRDVLLDALNSYASTSADFVDCLLAARSKVRNVTVYTFDQTDFKKLDVNWESP